MTTENIAATGSGDALFREAGETTTPPSADRGAVPGHDVAQPPGSPAPRRGFFRRHPWLTGFGLAVILAAVGAWLAAGWAVRDGRHFFRTGKQAVDALVLLAGALEAGDLEAVAARYADGYGGGSLGVADLALESDRDGLRVYRFRPTAAADRAAAVDEWRRYLAGFESIDKAELHVHRMEEWGAGEPIVATVRYELIGTPRGEPRPGIDRGLFRMRFERVAGELPRIAGAELIEGDRVIAAEPHFVDVAAEAGIDFENRYYPPYLTLPLAFVMLRYGPAGITTVDYDDDGFYDLFIPDGVESRLFRNLGEGPDGLPRFEDVTAAAGLSGLDGVSVGLFADVDNDGHKDFFVSRTFQPNQLFRNRGDGTFVDVTEGAGLAPDCCTTVASWADYDNDGDLDLYVGRYLEPREEIPTTFYARNGEFNRFYRNDGTGADGQPRFTDVTEEAGIGEVGLCLGSVFGDYDDDGDADLYVVNDFGRNTLYRNEGDGTFEDVTVATGTLAYGAGMNASMGDYNNDGRIDVYVTNIRSEYAWFGEKPTARRYLVNSIQQGVWWTDFPLYFEIFRQSGPEFHKVFQQMGSGNNLLRNDGPGPDGGYRFTDVTWDTGTNPPGWFWGASFADFDNDGWQDLYAANGWVYAERDTELELDFFEGVVEDQIGYKSGVWFDPDSFGGRSWHGYERNRHMRNEGPGPDGRFEFTEIGLAAGTGIELNSRGVAVADFRNRGVLDVAVAASTDRHALLENRVGADRNWLQVELRGAGPDLPNGSNRDAVGARAIVRRGDEVQMREVVLGDGYGSQNSLRLHFGLGDDPRPIDELEVRWPRSGIVQRFEGVPVNRIVEVTEGAEEWVEKSYAPPAGGG